MAAARVLLLQSGRPEAVSFARSVCGLLGAGPGLGPWPTYCSFEGGRLVLSAEPFPGSAAKLPLQVGRREAATGGGESPNLGPDRAGNLRREARGSGLLALPRGGARILKSRARLLRC